MRSSKLNDLPADPRVAAIWLMHGRAAADLLRAHGRAGAAKDYEQAMATLTDILAAELGQARLTAALDWVSEQMWADRATSTALPIRH